MLLKKSLLATLLAFPFLVQAANFPSQVSEVTNQVIEQTVPYMAKEEVKQQMTQKDAEELVEDYLNMLVAAKVIDVQGWNDDQNIYVTAQTAVTPLQGLKEADLLAIRAMKYEEAVLKAKEDIIKYIRQHLSAEQTMTLPQTGLSSEYDKRVADLQEQLKKRTEAYQQAVQGEKDAKSGTIGDVNLEDFYRESVAAVINKIGGNVDVNKLKAEQAARVEKAKQELLALQAEIDTLKQDIEKNKEALGQTNISQTETFASMVLAGAMVAAQFESIKNGQYKIAVVLTWSPEQERLLTALANKQVVDSGRTGPMTIGQYIARNDWSSAIGGRKFIDSKGDLHVLGIGAAPIRGNTSAMRNAAEIDASSQANSQIALAFQGDMKTHTLAQRKIQEALKDGKGGEGTINTENFAKDLRQSVNVKGLQGITKRYSKVLVHPLTGQNVLVYIADMSLKGANAARNAEKINYQAAIEMTNADNQSAGVKAGMDQVLQAAKKSNTSFEAGRREGMTAAQPEAPAPKASSIAAPQASAPSAGNTAAPTSQGVREGGVAGAGVTTPQFFF